MVWRCPAVRNVAEAACKKGKTHLFRLPFSYGGGGQSPFLPKRDIITENAAVFIFQTASRGFARRKRLFNNVKKQQLSYAKIFDRPECSDGR